MTRGIIGVTVGTPISSDKIREIAASVPGGGVTDEQIASAVENYLEENPVVGTPGNDGTSVTVKSVSESTADGGSNVVTFSDGKTLTVRNGSKGSPGDNYVLTADDKEEIAELAAGIVDTALLALIGTGEVTA